MRKNDWHLLIFTEIVTLLPILFGVYYDSRLPEQMAIHFDVSGQADSFVPKLGFILFSPLILALVQAILLDSRNKGIHHPGLQLFLVWLIPTLSLGLHLATIYYNLGHALDFRLISGAIIGLVWLILGNYIPKVSAMTPNVEGLDRRKLGYTFVIGGLLLLMSLMLPPIVTMVLLLGTTGMILFLVFQAYFNHRRKG